MELRSRFFSTRDLRPFKTGDFKNGFWEVKVVSLQYHKRPSCKIIKRSSGVGHSRQGNLKLAVFQNGSWFFAYCQKKFKHTKVCFSSVWLGVVKNKRGYLGERTLKLAVSQAWIDEFSWFFTCWYWCDDFWLDC